jgi:cell wall-associated NlpC family hydrolase
MKDCKHLRAAAIVALLMGSAFTGACASGGLARPQPFPSPAGTAATPPVRAAEPAPAPAPPAASPAPTVVDTALSFRGTPYRNGGSDPKGFDCSGFTQWVFARYGVALPREVADQFKVGRKIKENDLEPGDLVFFHTVSRGASHVGIFVAGDRFVHAPSSKGVVRVESINSSYWAKRYLGARRVPAALAPSEPAVVRRHPSGAGSTVASAAGRATGARGSNASD